MSDPLLLNVAGPLRTALIDSDPIATRLEQYEGEPAVFTRRPVPDGATYPLIVVSPDIAISDEDGLKSRRPVVLRDLVAYGEQPDQYRVVEELGYLIRALFHRQKFSVIVPGYRVVDIVARGPQIAPTDDERHLARIVALRIRLQDLAT